MTVSEFTKQITDLLNSGAVTPQSSIGIEDQDSCYWTSVRVDDEAKTFTVVCDSGIDETLPPLTVEWLLARLHGHIQDFGDFYQVQVFDDNGWATYQSEEILLNADLRDHRLILEGGEEFHTREAAQ